MMRSTYPLRGGRRAPRAGRRVPRQQSRIGRQRDPGGQHELPALQQVRRVRDLEDVHPADPGVKARGTRQHLRAAAPDDVQAEQVTDGGKHNVK